VTVSWKIGDESYLHSWEGTIVLWVTTALNAFVFATLIDRAPTNIAGSEATVEELSIAPETGVFPFPIGLELGWFYGVVSVFLVWLLAFRSGVDHPMDARQRIRGSMIVFGGYAAFWILDILLLPGGTGISGRGLFELPVLVYLICLVHGLLVVAPAIAAGYPLLPARFVTWSNGSRKEKALEIFIEGNWRWTRVMMSLTLTGAIGTTLSFVLSRASPNLLFLLAILGYVVVTPLFIVWFLMRRIREAEKELRPNLH
jgi:hypothetical protein